MVSAFVRCERIVSWGHVCYYPLVVPRRLMLKDRMSTQPFQQSSTPAPGSGHAHDAGMLGSERVQEMPVSRIEPPRGLAYIGWKELWAYRELFVFLTWRDIQVRYKQTVIGAAWALLQPIMMMVVFTIFLGRLAKLPTSDTPYPLFVFCGLLPWTFFASAITNAGNSVVGSEKLVTKVYFPRLIIPLASIGSSMVDLLVASSLLVVLLFWYEISITASVLLAPLFLLLIALTAVGTGAVLAALNVAYRDFRFVVPFFMQLWLFATPSIFMDINSLAGGNSASQVSAWLPWLLNLNPMVLLIATFRDCILGQPSGRDPMRGGCHDCPDGNDRWLYLFSLGRAQIRRHHLNII